MSSWEKMVLFCLMIALCWCCLDLSVRNFLFPARWECTVNTDCGRQDAVMLDDVKKVLDSECQSLCEGIPECGFYSYSSRACQMYKQCNTKIPRVEVHLYAKHATSLLEFLPQAVINAIAVVFPTIAGHLFVCTLCLLALTACLPMVLEEGLSAYFQRDAVMKAAIAFNVISAVLLLSMHHQRRGAIDQIMREESGKTERLKSIERDLWQEVRTRGDTARYRYRFMSMIDIIIGCAMIGSICYFVYYIRNEALGAESGVWQLNLANILSRGVFGVDSKRIISASVLTCGVCLASAPLAVGLKKCERGVLGLAFDPVDDLHAAMESVARETLSVENDLKKCLQVQDGLDTVDRARVDEFSTSIVRYAEVCKSDRTTCQNLEARVLRRAKQCMREYADALQVTPDVLFNRDSLLDEQVAAIQESAESSRGCIRSFFGFFFNLFTGFWCRCNSRRTSAAKTGSSAQRSRQQFPSRR